MIKNRKRFEHETKFNVLQKIDLLLSEAFLRFVCKKLSLFRDMSGYNISPCRATLSLANSIK